MLLELVIFLGSVMVLLSSLASTYAAGRYYARIVLYTIAVFVVSVLALPLAIVMAVIGRKYDTNGLVSAIFYNLIVWLMGIEVEVEGAEYLQTNPAVYVANHQSAFDIFFIASIWPKRCSVTSKKSVQWVPGLGQWMTLSGAIFIDRGSNKKAVASLEQAGQDIKEKSLSVWIFPEGTRTSYETPNMLPFKKGAFHLAQKAGVPIVPVVCENYWRLYHKGVFESGKLKVRVLPPIPTTGLTAADAPDLAVRTRDAMLVALKEISVPVSGAVAAADNASLEKISQAVLPSTSAAPSTRPASAPEEKALRSTESDVIGPPTQTTERSSVVPLTTERGTGEPVDPRQRKDSSTESSGTDDEMVIVDRPT